MKNFLALTSAIAAVTANGIADARWYPNVGSAPGGYDNPFDACKKSIDNWLGFDEETDRITRFFKNGERYGCTVVGEGLLKSTGRTDSLGAKFRCEDGESMVAGQCLSVNLQAARCEAEAGNPIQLRTMNKRERVTDYVSGGPRPLALIRTYNSKATGTSRIGGQWATNFDRYAIRDDGKFYLTRPDGSIAHFRASDGGFYAGHPYKWTERRDIKDRLAWEGNGLIFTTESGLVERYEPTASADRFRIVSSVEPDGYRMDYEYDEVGRNTRVTDSFGRWLAFEYQPGGGLMKTATSFSGTVIAYDYLDTRTGGDVTASGYLSEDGLTVTLPEGFADGATITIDGHEITNGMTATPAVRAAIGVLLGLEGTQYAVRSVTYADGARVGYEYDLAGGAALLTGLTDERGVRFASWSYDAAGNAVSSEHIGGVERVELTHEFVKGKGRPFSQASYARTNVTDAYGRETEYFFDENYRGEQLQRLTEVTGFPSATCLGTTTSNSYDGSGNRTRSVDPEGAVTVWTYPSNAAYEDRGRPLTMTHAYGTDQAQTTTYEWVPGKALPARITTERLDTVFGYDANGRLVRKAVADLTGRATERVWTYEWTDEGLIDTVDGPLPGPQDRTDYDYGAFGFLSQVTTGEGYVTRITDHSPDGHPARIVEPDGTVTRIEYTPRGWPERIVRDGADSQAVTTMRYDEVGQLVRVGRPDGTFERYVWDDARRLVRIYNGAGETLKMTYDVMSELTEVRALGGDGALDLRSSMVRDELGRIRELIGGKGQRTLIDYDREDRPVKETGPRGGETTFAWDALDRLEAATDALSGVTATTYETDGTVADVTDPKSLVTTYERNGFGEVTAIVSPDTGRTEFERDEAGRVTRRQDARGEVATYAYDGEDRVTSVTYQSDAGHGRTYAYDEAGRLAGITDTHGGQTYEYDARGNVAAATRTTGNRSYALGATYDLADKPVTVTYPSGRTFSYGYDGAGRLASIVTAQDGVSEDVATGIAYDAGGNLTTLTHGNGAVLSRTFDLASRLTAIDTMHGGVPIQSLDYAYDPADNVRSITDGVRFERSQAFRYDLLGRLTHAEGAYGSLDYRYDGVGNRTRRFGMLAGEAIDERSRYVAGRHRLERVVDAGAVRRFEYHASGQVEREVREDGQVFRYELDPEGRVDRVAGRDGLVAAYGYDDRRLRAFKRLPGADGPGGGPVIHFVYDAQGRLIAEHDGRTGAALREYAYVGWLPVAMFQGGQAYAIHADQVAMPQLVTDASGAVVMDRVATPFGEVVPALSSVPEADALALAFPGQRGDGETGLSQNWHRDYDPQLGRYVQSDPIGLAGGLSTYGYAMQNPVRYVDPNGLNPLGDALKACPWVNSRVCNETDDDLSVWDGKGPVEQLPPGQCTAWIGDKGDFAYRDGQWTKCEGGPYSCTALPDLPGLRRPPHHQSPGNFDLNTQRWIENNTGLPHRTGE